MKQSKHYYLKMVYIACETNGVYIACETKQVSIEEASRALPRREETRLSPISFTEETG